MLKQKVIKKIDNNREELVILLKELIRQNTVNPPGNEFKIVNIIKKRFNARNIRFDIFEKEKGRTNIIGYIGRGKLDLLIACHSDVVHAGSGWKTNPFVPVIKQDKLYGRGATDNKGPLASIILLAEILNEFQPQFKGQFIIGVFADEEKGKSDE